MKRDDEAAKLLPEKVRASGTLSLASSVGAPPGAFYEEDGRTLAGADIDFADAVARKLGLRLKREVASFEAILPALGSGKYDLGTGNFGVTEERRRTIDFVTYINDGQGFAVRDDSDLKKVTDLTQLCGLTVGTGAGTTFEATLEENRHRCADSRQEAVRGQDVRRSGSGLDLAPAGPQRRPDVHDQRAALRRGAAGGAALPQRVQAARRRLRVQEGHPAGVGLPGGGQRPQGRRHLRPHPEEVGHLRVGDPHLADLAARDRVRP